MFAAIGTIRGGEGVTGAGVTTPHITHKIRKETVYLVPLKTRFWESSGHFIKKKILVLKLYCVNVLGVLFITQKQDSDE